jgi:DNA repair protein RecN (Recombination protein N)
LIHKHQASDLEELLLIQSQIKDKLLGFEQINERKSVLEGEAKILKDDLDLLAAKLSSARAAQIPGFEKAVMDVLARVNMEQAVFKIELESAETYNAYGKDKLKFLCATNKGSRMLPLKDVASGGELSRIALSIKSLVANALSLPTMIFDEIDTGVSGQVALQMGHLLKKLATGHQVIVITHTPQVAARADQHMKVYKTTEGEQNVTKISVLSKSETIEAVAVMLSTEPPTPAALNNAKELISLN